MLDVHLSNDHARLCVTCLTCVSRQRHGGDEKSRLEDAVKETSKPDDESLLK